MNCNALRLSTRWVLTGLVGLGLAACGGAGEERRDDGATRSAAAAAEPIAPLLDNDGAVMPSDPRLMPADSAARTRSGRYASARQAEQIERTLGERVLRVDIGCCGIEAADLALNVAYGMQAAHDLPNSVPVLVRAADLRLGASTVNRLSDAGYTRVWLVTP